MKIYNNIFIHDGPLVSDGDTPNLLCIAPTFNHDPKGGRVIALRLEVVQGGKGLHLLDCWLARDKRGIEKWEVLPDCVDRKALHDLLESDTFQKRLRDLCADWRCVWDHSRKEHVGYSEGHGFLSDPILTEDELAYVTYC